LSEAGFKIGVAYEKKGFWVSKKEKVHAATRDSNGEELNQKNILYVLILNYMIKKPIAQGI